MRLLVAEDGPLSRSLTKQFDEQGVSVTTTTTVSAALDELHRTTFDVAVLGLALSDGSALEILQAMRAQRASTYVIILSAEVHEDDRVEALEHGADDYVTKPFFVRELVAKVLAVRRRQLGAHDHLLVYGTLAIDLRSRRVTMDDAVLHLTPLEFDLLAFLAARPGHLFSRDELLHSVWRSSSEWQQTSTVTEHIGRLRAKLVPDATQPSLIKTVRGIGYRFDPPAAVRPVHALTPRAAGDGAPDQRPGSDDADQVRQIATGVVTEVADAIIVTDPNFKIRSWNEAAERLYGWPEDAVLGRHAEDLLRVESPDDLRHAARRTLDETGRWFGESRIVTRDGSQVNVSASSTLIRDDAGAVVAVVGVHRPAPTQLPELTPAFDRPDAAAVRRGLDGDELACHFEPIVTLNDWHTIAVEALVRWDHPTLGSLDPRQFLDEIDDADVIAALDDLVLHEACLQTAEWRRVGLDLHVAVPLSTAQLTDPTFFEAITTTLTETALDPHALWLQLTETALVEDLDQVATLLHRASALGVRVAIDSFGTGWASLTYLRKLPIHALKIDEQFIVSVAHDLHDAAITRSIVSLGRELGLQVIANGVATVAQQTALSELGCRYGEGPLYGGPVAARALSLQRTRRLATPISP